MGGSNVFSDALERWMQKLFYKDTWAPHLKRSIPRWMWWTAAVAGDSLGGTNRPSQICLFTAGIIPPGRSRHDESLTTPRYNQMTQRAEGLSRMLNRISTVHAVSLGGCWNWLMSGFPVVSRYLMNHVGM